MQECFVSSLVETGPVVLEKKGFFNFVNVFSLFRNHLPLEKGVVLHLNKPEFPVLAILEKKIFKFCQFSLKKTNLNPLQPKDALCQVWLKLAEQFQRRRFYMPSMYFPYFVIISPWKKV